MDFTQFTDIDLDDMRATPKTIVNTTARWVPKGSHRQKDFTAVAHRDEGEVYRIFLRVSEHNGSVFSAGIMRIFPSGDNLVLARYNGGYHPHGNIIERTKVPAVTHKHLATERYIRAGLDPDGYAEPITGYNDIDGAFATLRRDCGIADFGRGPSSTDAEPTAPHTPNQPGLFD
ncbi:hypothetical protein [Burkholderia gladioli]|uniref:hypothetical protein n=1 Tax=Burkholderia gladioli TaxID=28095 RepID=UPI00163E1A4A|nr:hypothetical protein [Burkholderia gladioli]